MKTVIPESLVSVYDITVPYVLDVRKLRKRLDAELEKLHPCFPDRCAVDYRLKLQAYGKRPAGIHIRAVVMDRLQLAALRKENRGCTLYTGGSHPYPVFSAGSRKRHILFAAAITLTVVAALFLVRSFSADRGGGLTAAAETALQEAERETAVSLPFPLADDVLPADAGVAPDFVPFIEAVYSQGGRISSVSWNAESGAFVMKANGLFPEQLAAAAQPDAGMGQPDYALSFGPIAYNSGVPELEVTLFAPQRCQKTDAAVSVAAVRDLVLEYGGVPVSETVNPPSFSGSVPETAWASFAPRMEPLIHDVIRTLELVHEGSSVMISLSLSDCGNGVSDLRQLPLSDLACVFWDAPGLPFEAVADEWESALSEGREIGRITREDGSAVVFFHGDDGQIERRVYEN